MFPSTFMTAASIKWLPLVMATVSGVMLSAEPQGKVLATGNAAVTFTLNSNGLTSVLFKGTEYNYKYGEGFVTSVKYGENNTFLYGPPCTKTLEGTTISQRCTAGPARMDVVATHSLLAPDTIAVDISITNRSDTIPISEATFSTLGFYVSRELAKGSRLGKINIDNPIGYENFGTGRFAIWLETPGPEIEIGMLCSGSTICKHQPVVTNIEPGKTKTFRVAGRFAEDVESDPNILFPEAYERHRNAYPMVVRWPDRRPVMAWFIADGSSRNARNPRGYFQNPNLNALDPETFRRQALASANRIRTLMDERPVRPQGLIIWDMEGQEFIHPTTYIGDPRAFASGYAAEMNAVADDLFQVFKDAGYRVGVTVRPQYLEFGTQLPPSCTYNKSHDFKSYYIKVDNDFKQRFHACYDVLGLSWLLVPDANGGQTMYPTGSLSEVTTLLKNKVRYAHDRWGATLFYIDSAVWSGGRPIEASIIGELQKSFPDSLFIPEQEVLSTVSAGVPYSDPRVGTDPRLTPLSWRWVYPTAAFAVALGDCQGSCWSANLDSFSRGQKIGDIALYAQPTQMNAAHLKVIENMILDARKEMSQLTVSDSNTNATYRFQGDVNSAAPYPVKLRVYFAANAAGLPASTRYCEAGGLMGENRCSLDLSNMRVSEVRYYDFTETLVKRGVPSVFNATPSVPSIAGIVNSASYGSGPIAPGQLATIFGANLGPETLSLNSSGVTVTFDGAAAELLYVSAGQVGVIVPVSISGKSSTAVQVSYGNQPSAAISMAVRPTSPGIFTANSSGSGPGAIINQTGAVNSPATPAAKGSIVAIYLTGAGITSSSGAIAAPVSITIGGQPAMVAYAGVAPASVQGLYQVNAAIPANVSSTEAPVLVTIGGVASQSGVTVSVQ